MNNTVKNLLTIFAGIGLALLILQFVQPTLVSGDSMDPYLKHHDYLIMNKNIYRHSDPEYGDIIIFPREGKLLIKRVIGKPGDTIDIKEGKVYRNGEAIDDYTDLYTEPEMTRALDEDEYFVLGDNRTVSLDSRSPDVGTVRKSEIIGKAFLRLFPRTGKI